MTQHVHLPQQRRIPPSTCPMADSLEPPAQQPPAHRKGSAHPAQENNGTRKFQ